MAKPLKPDIRAARRRASLESKQGGGLSLGFARMIGEWINPEGSDCLVREIVAYSVTKIFHAPVNWPDGCGACWVRIPGESPEYSATLAGGLKDYLDNASELGQFAIDPDLRETVEDVEKRAGDKSTYLVVEERGQITGCRMDRGECWPGLDAGRDGVVIFKTSEGAWPTFIEQVERDTALLAAMRTETKTPHPYELHARNVCYITDQEEPAHAVTGEMGNTYGGFRLTKAIAGGKVAEWVDRLGENAGRLLQASADPAVSEPLAAIRLDEAGEEEHFRLWYLRLWQALVDVGMHYDNQAVKVHLEELEKQQRWKDLTKHRVEIAHWHTEIIDYEKVADLHRFAVEIADYILTHGNAKSSTA